IFTQRDTSSQATRSRILQLPSPEKMMSRERVPGEGHLFVGNRPYVVLSCAMSIDGYIDDASPARLHLSNQEDLERVDAERARSDAILVGAGTVRRDDPELLVRSEA